MVNGGSTVTVAVAVVLPWGDEAVRVNVVAAETGIWTEPLIWAGLTATPWSIAIEVAAVVCHESVTVPEPTTVGGVAVKVMMVGGIRGTSLIVSATPWVKS